MSNKELSFQEKILQRVEKAVLEELAEGRWIKADYGAIIISKKFLSNLYDNIDMDKVLEIATERLETKIADKILNNMAQEISTDVNKILSDNEMREEIRFYLRKRMNEKIEQLKRQE